MKTRRLGRTDLDVSVICLGAMQFGWTAGEEASFQVLDAYVEVGGNFIDTADMYIPWPPSRPGLSEEILGRWMKARGNRQHVIIATKVRGRMSEGPDGEGLSGSHIERAIEGSLRRLQVEYVDLYQCHWPDEDTPIEETLAAFQSLIAGGKVRYIGASNYSAQQLGEALSVSTAKGLPTFATLQPHYNLVHRSEFEGELSELCRRESIGVIPYSPLAGGFLTGKYRAGQPPPESARADRVQRYMTAQGLRVLETVERIAQVRSSGVPAVAMAWVMQKPGIASAITGANSLEQLWQLLPALELELTPDEMEQLDAVSAGM